jgi:GTP cyclohydrolase I
MNSLKLPERPGGMPDIATHGGAGLAETLDWVGMAAIHLPMTLALETGSVAVAAKAQAFVNLGDPEAKGIHMSRLYLALDEASASGPVSPAALGALLEKFLESHAELSTHAFIEVSFDLNLRRPALVSDNSGWNSYPVRLRAERRGAQTRLELALSVTYSSTCPCSAALARQLIQEQFDEDFAGQTQIDAEAFRAWLGTEQGIMATPHSQRSVAEVRLSLTPTLRTFPIEAMVNRLEGALKTPVQAAVKREDEQAFARLNGQNLMFCEDAARRLKAALLADEQVVDFWLRVNHFESLHGHDAVAVATAGVAGGYTPDPG